MKIIYVLIPLSLMLLGLAVRAFFWAVRNDQFDDLDTPALDILDDEVPGTDDAVEKVDGEGEPEDSRKS